MSENNKNNKVFTHYKDINRDLKNVFIAAFGKTPNSGVISLEEVENMIQSRANENYNHNLPVNRLVEIPTDLYNKLVETYIKRYDEEYGREKIGCIEDEDYELDGITDLALLMYLSNRLAKVYEKKENQIFNSTKEEYRKKKGECYSIKKRATEYLIANLFVTSKTTKKYKDYFSYGDRVDNNGDDSFAIDLPLIGQICVHYGWEQKKNSIIYNAEKIANSILKEKLKEGQISQDQFNLIIEELNQEGVIPEYEGKLYEYNNAMPIAYSGKKVDRYSNLLGNPDIGEITSEDLITLKKQGLNKREIYYFCIMLGASKSRLKEIDTLENKEKKVAENPGKISPEQINSLTRNVRIGEFNKTVKELNNFNKNKQNPYKTNDNNLPYR